MYNPISSYRIQFNKDFRVKDLEKQLEYLSLLGVGTIYASPVFQATPGSGHGYDVVDPLQFNAEVTDQDTFLSVREKLRHRQLGWLQDIVPNHMAYHPANKWLMDVLEKGSASGYAGFFDFEPGVPGKEQRLMVPFLGVPLEEAIENKEIKLGWKKGSFTIEYFDNAYPVNHEAVRLILENDIVDAPPLFIEVWKNYLNFKTTPGFLNDQWDKAKEEARYIYSIDRDTVRFIDNLLLKWSSTPHLLRELLDKQHYELCHWQETEKRINFRRFFTVNGLICLSMEHPDVFDRFHQYIGEMVKNGSFSGLRIDHIDGLNDPNSYLKKLRELCGNDTYIVAEKILEYDEDLPSFWPIQGTTGYDFLASVNNLLTSVNNYDQLKKLYREVTTIQSTPAELIYQNKRMILTTRMHGEWDNVFRYFNRMEFVNYEKENISHEEIKEALGEFMLACPVYRLYPRVFPLRNDNRKVVEEIFEKAHKRNPALKTALEKLEDVLLSNNPEDEKYNEKLGMFFARLMQFTGPLMAKGVEDTSMYQYNCFIAHNEVGDAIHAGGITVEQFHQQMLQRQQNWPLTMNTTSTHDTKRGEDVRARLNVISELADQWEEHVHQWMQLNQKLKIRLDSGLLEPSTSVEYFIYQTLLGTFPFNGKADEEYMQRIDEYLVKALREAKRKVSWRDPDETYENTVVEFTRKMLDPGHDFLLSFVPFQQKVAWRGIINSLVQKTLKITCPGVPDIYQGTELWDFTLVDPDNRQPVDYDTRHQWLLELKEMQKQDPAFLVRKITTDPYDGKFKLWLTHLLLTCRKDNPELFLKGEYIPLNVTGKLKFHVLAFARNYKDKWLVVIVPLLTANLSDKINGYYFSETDWKDTAAGLPKAAPAQWQELFSGEKLKTNGIIKVGDVLQNLLPAVLFHEK